jgi:hypothetical protein
MRQPPFPDGGNTYVKARVTCFYLSAFALGLQSVGHRDRVRRGQGALHATQVGRK